VARPLSGEWEDGQARVHLAAALADDDPETARELVRSVGLKSGPGQTRQLVELAAELASWHPVRAEQLIRGAGTSQFVDSALPRILHAMAGRFPQRARRLLESPGVGADPLVRAYSLGMIALAAAPKDPALGKRCLRDAIDELPRDEDQRAPGTARQDAASVTMALLPVAEAVWPDLVEETFWHALSLRIPRGPDNSPNSRGWRDPVLALLTTRYDRVAARVYYQPLADRFGPLLRVGLDGTSLLWAGAELEPAMAVRMVENLAEEESRAKNRSLWDVADDLALDLASWLADDERRRWDRPVAEGLNLWTPGTRVIE
jgi:hypothetical protein